MYAVIAPGFSCVYTNWKDVERIKKLYPYPKFKKCNSESEAAEWIKRNQYARQLDSVYNYGNTFDNFYVDAKYKIAEDCVYYVLDVSRLGRLRLFNEDPNMLIEYKGSKIYIKYSGISVSNETIPGHLSVIYTLLNIVGPYIDLNLRLDYYALFYALTIYSKGNSRSIVSTRKLMQERQGAVSLSFKFNSEV